MMNETQLPNVGVLVVKAHLYFPQSRLVLTAPRQCFGAAMIRQGCFNPSDVAE
jgi:hypothetical protein